MGPAEKCLSKTRFLSEPAGKYNLAGDGRTSWLGTVRVDVQDLHCSEGVSSPD